MGKADNGLKLIRTLQQAGFSAALATRSANSFSELRSFKRGAYFQLPGKVCDEVGLLSSGLCRYYYETEKGADVTRWCSLSGDFVTSLASFISRQPSTEYIECIKPSQMWLIDRTAWEQLYAQEAEMRSFWLQTMEHTYIGMEERVYNLIARNASERYQWFVQWQPRMLQEVPDKYMAAMLGIQPRHLSRLRAERQL